MSYILTATPLRTTCARLYQYADFLNAFFIPAIDALEKSNQDISTQTAKAEEAEKKATSEKKWLYIAIASALALGAVVVIKLF